MSSCVLLNASFSLIKRSSPKLLSIAKTYLCFTFCIYLTTKCLLFVNESNNTHKNTTDQATAMQPCRHCYCYLQVFRVRDCDERRLGKLAVDQALTCGWLCHNISIPNTVRQTNTTRIDKPKCQPHDHSNWPHSSNNHSQANNPHSSRPHTIHKIPILSLPLHYHCHHHYVRPPYAFFFSPFLLVSGNWVVNHGEGFCLMTMVSNENNFWWLEGRRRFLSNLVQGWWQNDKIA